MESGNNKILENLISKLQSPLDEIRNRAINTLYTKINTKIVSQHELKYCEQIPGMLFKWINDTAPPQNELLWKVLCIVEKYTLTEAGLKLLNEYEAMEFLEEFRKYLMKQNTVVFDDHAALIKKIIKFLIPREQQQLQEQQQQLQQKQIDNEDQQSLQGGEEICNNDIQGEKRYQESKDGRKAQKTQQNNKQQGKTKRTKVAERKGMDSGNGNTKGSSTIPNSSKPSSKMLNKLSEPSKLTFTCTTTKLNKQVDHELYSLMMQLKHGKKQVYPKVLFSIKEIVQQWGSKFFSYKAQLIQELVEIGNSRLNGEIACQIINMLVKQMHQMHVNLEQMNALKALQTSGHKIDTQIVEVQIDSNLFMNNPFSSSILRTLCDGQQKQKVFNTLPSSNTIIYMLRVTSPFWPQYTSKTLSLLKHNSRFKKQYLSQKNQPLYKQLIYSFVGSSCKYHPNMSNLIVTQLLELFPSERLETISNQIPQIANAVRQESCQISFQSLKRYSESTKLEIHQISSHINHLQKGIAGLKERPQLVSVYCDCLLTLAISVANTDPLKKFYPKIKQLILDISLHESQSCRVAVYLALQELFITEQKVYYLSKGYFKSEMIKMVFTDFQFLKGLFVNSLNQPETCIICLQILKILQATPKHSSQSIINSCAPIFHVISSANSWNTSNQKVKKEIKSLAHLISSRIPKKFTVTNILLNLFSCEKSQYQSAYEKILGLQKEDSNRIRQLIKSIQTKDKSKNSQKMLKYSSSTLRNYINILQNPKLDMTIKHSALYELVECVSRIDLSNAENEVLNEIDSVQSFSQNVLKKFLYTQSFEQYESLFIGMINVYSTIQRRRKFLQKDQHHHQQPIKQTISNLNQSQPHSNNTFQSPQVYLNLLIRLSQYFKQQNSQSNSTLISTSMAELIKNTQRKQVVYAADFKAHWILQHFSFVRLFEQKQKLIRFSQPNTALQEESKNTRNPSNASQGKDQSDGHSILKTFIENSALKIKTQSRETLIEFYSKLLFLTAQSSSQRLHQEQVMNEQYIRSISSILENQLSVALRNKHQSEILFLEAFLVEIRSIILSLQTFLPSLKLIFTYSAEFVPHFMDSLVNGSNLSNQSKNSNPILMQMVLMSILKNIGLNKCSRKIHQFLISSESHHSISLMTCLAEGLTKLSQQQLSKIIKLTLTQTEATQSHSPQRLMLRKTLLKIMTHQGNLQTFVQDCSQYTQMLLIDNCVKNTEGKQPYSDDSIIYNQSLLVISAIGERVIQSVECYKLAEGIVGGVHHCLKNKQQHFTNNALNLALPPELVCLKILQSTLAVKNRLTSVLLNGLTVQCQRQKSLKKNINQQQPSDDNNLTLQNVSLILQTLVVLLKVSEYSRDLRDKGQNHDYEYQQEEVCERSDYQQNESQPDEQQQSLRLIGIAVEGIAQVLTQLSMFQNAVQIQLFFSSAFNFVGFLASTQRYKKISDKADLADLAAKLLQDSSLGRQSESEIADQHNNQEYTNTCLMAASIFAYLNEKLSDGLSEQRHQHSQATPSSNSNSKQLAHYFLSSGRILKVVLSIMMKIKTLIMLITDQHPNPNQPQPQSNSPILTELLESSSLFMVYLFIHEPEYFSVKIHQLLKKQSPLQFFRVVSRHVQIGGVNTLTFSMKLLATLSSNTCDKIEMNTSTSKIYENAAIFIKFLNQTVDNFNQSEQEQDDSSDEDQAVFMIKKQREQAQIASSSKQPIHWIKSLITLALERGHIMQCHSLLALSIPAKASMIQNFAFLKIVKATSLKLDKKINQIKSHLSSISTNMDSSISANRYGLHHNKSNKNMGSSQAALSHSRRTVTSQIQVGHANSPQQERELTEEWFINELELLTVFFMVHPYVTQFQHKFKKAGQDFNAAISEHRQALRRVFHLVDKFYFLYSLVSAGKQGRCHSNSSGAVLNVHKVRIFCKSFEQMLYNMSQSYIFSLPLSTFVNEQSPKFITETAKNIIDFAAHNINNDKNKANVNNDYQRIQQSLQLLGSLCCSESVRSFIYKQKLIQQLNGRLNRYQQKTDRNNAKSLNFFFDVVQFYLNLSKFKDSHSKILTLINQVYHQKAALLSQQIIKLMCNLCAYKSNKVMFMQNRQIHKIIMGQLQSEEIEYKCTLIILLYNLMYRHAPALKMYRRKDVIETITGIQWEQYEGWDDAKPIYSAVLEVLESDCSEVIEGVK